MDSFCFDTDIGDRFGYVARPAAPGPAVVVLHETVGLTPNIVRVADRMAAAGYLAVAPDLYAGERWTSGLREVVAALGAGGGPHLDTIAAVGRWAVSQDDCTGPAGVIGFSLGGGYALLAAGRAPFGAASAHYAPIPEDAATRLRGSAPILATYGGRDRTTAGRAERLDTALDEAGVTHEVTTYPRAGHSYLGDGSYPLAVRAKARSLGMHAGPEPESARATWAQVDAWFGRHLVRPTG